MQTIPKFLFATVLAGAAYTIAQPVQALSFTPNSGNMNIFDDARTDFTVDVFGFTNGASGTYTYSLNLDINHPDLMELEGFLISPSGSQTLGLFTTVSGSNLNNTTFIDTGSLLTLGNTPYNGSFSPQGEGSVITSTTSTVTNFDGFNTIDPNGTWTLRFFDNTAGNVGTLNNATLEITEVTPVPFEFDGSAGLAMIGGGLALRHFYKKRKESGK